ncbi:hypothetical protein Tamer19_47370 [Cupriavidus sp. TA19]|nr:hypothetical protein Tamer19_47370 [Cupriavidus sp. TA19]
MRRSWGNLAGSRWGLRGTEGLGFVQVVNSAGIVHQSSAMETSGDCWAQTLEVNLTGVWRMTRSFAPLVKWYWAAGKRHKHCVQFGSSRRQQVIAAPYAKRALSK